ncbi:MAG TPA: cation:proton antiporter [Candidatus Wunengus sp. YC61]|uniref:cation:proton antiporter n=1 Tax=Candidatus Wunengus sp. YC61 TaxID=3367698 RepID=UPI004026C4EA
MRTFKYNMVFVIVLISFYCFVVIGSPPLEAEYSAPSKESEPIRIDIKNETESLFFEQILSPKKYLKRYLETAKKEGLHEKSPDREYQSIVVEKEATSTVVGKDAHPTVSSLELPATSLTTQTPTEGSETLSIIPGKESSSAPIIEEKENLHEKSSIANSNQPVDKEHPLVVEEKGTQTPAVVDNMLLQFLTGKEPPTVPVEEKDYQEKSLTDEGHQPGVSFSETLQDAKEESTPITIVTPEFHSGTIAGEKSLPLEAEGTQTLAVDNKFHLTTDENGSSFTSAEESSYTATEGSTDVLIEEAKEPEKGISLPEPPAEIGKKAEYSKPTWDIWHKDPTHNVILAVAIILIAAKIAGWMARMLRLPEVVGKLIIGMILGNVFAFTGWDFFDFLRTMPFVKMVSYFGTLILLFTAGLNTDLRALLRVGTSSLLVGLGGIIVPAGLGLMVGHFLLPDTSSGTKLLLAIILCNSSTGLLLAVLSELKAINTLEGRVIAGATILTDIVVILIFGVVSEFAARGGVSLMGMSVSFGIAITSLIISLITILRYGEKFGNFLTRRMTEGLNIPIVVILSLLLAFMFGSVGLHTVIGAFIAGLFLRNVKLRNSDDGEHRNVESFIRPFYMLLVPILFVRVGAQVEMKSFLNMEAVSLGLAITGAAVIGKMFCSVCPIEKGINRLAIGIGMVTKMEGTLILSGIGRDMGMLNDAVFSSIIMVIALTSTICPSLLRLSLRKKGVHRKGLHIAAEKKELEEVTLN